MRGWSRTARARLLVVSVVLGALVACGKSDDDDDGGDAVPTNSNEGACGEVTEWDLEVAGVVEYQGGRVADAEVWLEERLWTAGNIFGTATTDADGRFEFEAPEVIRVEGCMGVAIDYAIVAVDGKLYGEKEVNSDLDGAIRDESFDVDFTMFPIVLE